MLLRMFFDAGSGVLLWAYDDEAKARFGYPVEAEMLDVSPELRSEIDQLVKDYDDTFPWDDPASGEAVAPDRIMFGYEDNPPFKDRIRALLPKLRAAMPEITFESDYEG